MITTNISITSANFNPGTGEMTCFVTAASPLYIYELIIESTTGLGAPVGLIRPGTALHPVLRSIFVDSTDPVFTTAAPFTLALTYDASYHLTEIDVVQGLAKTG
jgi:hypothetical protein